MDEGAWSAQASTEQPWTETRKKQSALMLSSCTCGCVIAYWAILHCHRSHHSGAFLETTFQAQSTLQGGTKKSSHIYATTHEQECNAALNGGDRLCTSACGLMQEAKATPQTLQDKQAENR